MALASFKLFRNLLFFFDSLNFFTARQLPLSNVSLSQLCLSNRTCFLISLDISFSLIKSFSNLELFLFPYEGQPFQLELIQKAKKFPKIKTRGYIHSVPSFPTHLIYKFNAKNVLITDVSRVTSTVSRVTYSVFKSLKIVLHSYNDLKIV